jgi:uncharacterized RDD family membrane protein YckC
VDLSRAFGLVVLPAVVFAAAYYPLMSQVSSGLVSPYPKADVRKRVYAAAIDSMLVVTAVILYQRLDSIAFPILGALYLLLRDGVRGQSIGKTVCGLTVINLETGKPATMPASMRRNIILLVPGANLVAAALELITISRDVQGQRLGDRLAQTQVVEGRDAKDLATEFVEWWDEFVADLSRAGRRRRRVRAVRFGAQG